MNNLVELIWDEEHLSTDTSFNDKNSITPSPSVPHSEPDLPPEIAPVIITKSENNNNTITPVSSKNKEKNRGKKNTNLVEVKIESLSKTSRYYQLVYSSNSTHSIIRNNEPIYLENQQNSMMSVKKRKKDFENCRVFCGWPKSSNLNNDGKTPLQRYKNAQWINSALMPDATKDLYTSKRLDTKFRRLVFIDMKIKRLGEVKTEEETFRAQFRYFLTWMASEEDIEKYDQWNKQKEKKFQQSNIEQRRSYSQNDLNSFQTKDIKQKNKKQGIKYQETIPLMNTQDQRDPGQLLPTDTNEFQETNEWIPTWIPSINFVNEVGIAKQERISNYKMKYGYEFAWDLKYRKFDVENCKWKNSNNDTTLDIEDPGDDQELLGFDPCQGRWIRVQYEVDMTFSKELELGSFPFDSQDFTIILKLAHQTIKEADLLPFPRDAAFLTFDPQYSVNPEWKLHRVNSEFAYSQKKKENMDKAHAMMYVHFKASRNWKSYIGPLLIALMMYVLGLGTFALRYARMDLGTQLQYCLVFLLADVNTLQLLFEKLPKIDYPTILGTYILGGFLFLSGISIWICTAGLWCKRNSCRKIDSCVFIGIFLLIQTLFILFARWRYACEQRKLTLRSATFNDANKKKENFSWWCCERPSRPREIQVKWSNSLVNTQRISDGIHAPSVNPLTTEAVSDSWFWWCWCCQKDDNNSVSYSPALITTRTKHVIFATNT